MVTAARRPKFSFKQYVRLADESNVKLEFAEGEVYAMAGGTPEHGAIALNVSQQLQAQLRNKACRVSSSDVRIRVSATGLTAYPDLSVVCGKLELDPEDRNTVINPVLIVEVLSPSTEDYDRGEKLANYKRIASVEEIVLVAHDREHVECFSRTPSNEWGRREAGPGERIELSSLGCVLDVAEVYRDGLGGSLARP